MKLATLAIATTLLTGTIAFVMADKDNAHQGHSHAEGEACTDACALPSHANTTAQDAFQKSEEEWRQILSDEEFRVLRKHGTEPAFRNEYHDFKGKGVYLCAGCDAPLFASKQKYNSGTGWPSFYDSIAKENIGTTRDTSYGMVRTEVHCSRCGGHLGHVFEDGPRPTGLRYCINSASIDFVAKDELDAKDLAAYKEDAK